MEHDFVYYLHQAWEVLKFIGILLIAVVVSAIVGSGLSNQRRNGRY